MDEEGSIEVLAQDRLVGPAEIAPLDESGIPFTQPLRGIVVGYAGEGRLHPLEGRDIPLEDVHEEVPVALEGPSDDIDDEILPQLHDVIQLREGHLRLDHPELGQVAPRLRFLRPEGRTEAVDLAEGGRVRLVVELSALGEIGLVAEVLRLEERGRPLAGVGGQDGGVEVDEAPPVEELPYEPDESCPDAQDCLLPGGP